MIEEILFSMNTNIILFISNKITTHKYGMINTVKQSKETEKMFILNEHQFVK